MTRITMFLQGASVSALLALGVVPAHAEGKADRARTAIAAAEAKVESANKMGSSTASPAMMAHAQAELATARENLKSGNKDTAIEQAIDAQRIADTAIGQTNRATAEAVSNNAAQAQQNAQSQVDAANARADSAVASAQDASDRAAAAQQQAAAASAQAEAARNQPQPVTTVTTVEKSSTRAPARKITHVVKKPASTYAGTTTAERTTTTVSTAAGQ